MCRYAQVYNQIRENIQQADAAGDLKWWSINRGPEMKMSWPTYEVHRMFVSLCDRCCPHFKTEKKIAMMNSDDRPLTGVNYLIW